MECSSSFSFQSFILNERIRKENNVRLQISSYSNETDVPKKAIFPLSLFNIALRFIANHILDVVSLCGFPDYVGHKIFHAVSSLKKLNITVAGETAVTDALRLFVTAYKQEILYSLDLKNSLLAINECLTPLLEITPYLHELDLRQCSLGDNHELIQHIANMERLQRLCLMDNSLSDEGIRNLTLPFRVMGKGPSCLQELDISYNSKITIKAMPWLAKFLKLKALSVNKTGMVSNLQTIESRYGFSYQPFTPVFKTIKTTGWASDLICDWLYNASQQCKHLKPSPSISSASIPKFYKRRKLSIEGHMNCGTITEEEPVILIRY